MFDEFAPWYLPSTTTPNSNPSFEDEVSKAKMPLHKREIGALEESLMSFRLSGPNERLSRHDQSDEESASSGDSTLQIPCRKPRRWLTRKEKGKMKLPEYETETETSDQRESKTVTSKDVPSRVRLEAAERDTKSVTQKLR